MATSFSIGVTVQTHSLCDIKYSSLSGTVTGAVSVDKNELTKVTTSKWQHKEQVALTPQFEDNNCGS
jgi:hypothetical protein